MSGARNIAGWRLAQAVANLVGEQLAARLNPTRAEEGLAAIQLQGQPLEGLSLLGLCATDPSAGVLALEECYVRGRDLVAAYALDPERHAHLEAVWRLLAAEDLVDNLASGAPPWAAAGVELIVSIHTDRLEDRVPLVVESRVPSGELFGLSARGGPCAAADSRLDLPAPHTEDQSAAARVRVDRLAPAAARVHFDRLGPPAAGVRFDRLRPPADTPAPAQALPAPVCLVYSLRAQGGGKLGYVEAACPSGVPSAELGWVARPAPAACVRYAVLPTALEKGVILRARVRGVFLAAGVPAKEHLRCAVAVYRALAAAGPVLGT